MDAYESIRNLPLAAVLAFLGVSQDWKPRKNGREWSGPCPIHKGKNKTSFSFDAQGKFHCFSCGAKGRGAIDLTMALRQVNFREAVEILKDVNVVPAPVEDSEPLPPENVPFEGTYEKFKVESDWLAQRGISPAMQEHFGVFEYRNDKRGSLYNGSVMLRIRRYTDGTTVGYLNRNVGEITSEKPKYRFPKGFQKALELFGAWEIKNQAPIKVGYVVESPFTVLKWQELGFPAVSPFGWNVSAQQIKILASLFRGVIYLPDRNKHQEALQSVGALASELWVKAPPLPDGCDDPENLDAESIRKLSKS